MHSAVVHYTASVEYIKKCTYIIHYIDCILSAHLIYYRENLCVELTTVTYFSIGMRSEVFVDNVT